MTDRADAPIMAHMWEVNTWEDLNMGYAELTRNVDSFSNNVFMVIGLTKHIEL